MASGISDHTLTALILKTPQTQVGQFLSVHRIEHGENIPVRPGGRRFLTFFKVLSHKPQSLPAICPALLVTAGFLFRAEIFKICLVSKRGDFFNDNLLLEKYISGNFRVCT